jgi:hypothetical protein
MVFRLVLSAAAILAVALVAALAQPLVATGAHKAPFGASPSTASGPVHVAAVVHGNARLARTLHVDVKRDGRLVYRGPLSGVGAVTAASRGAAGTHRYSFALSLRGGGDDLQGRATRVAFHWVTLAR